MRAIDGDALLKDAFENDKEYFDQFVSSGLMPLARGAIKRLIDKQPTIESPRDWAPCAEGLPEESKVYSVIAVYYQNGSLKDVVDNLWYYGNGEWQKYDDLCKVIAWKPYNPDHKEDAKNGMA